MLMMTPAIKENLGRDLKAEIGLKASAETPFIAAELDTVDGSSPKASN